MQKQETDLLDYLFSGQEMRFLRILLLLQEGCSIREAASLLKIAVSSASHLARKLERFGLVRCRTAGSQKVIVELALQGGSKGLLTELAERFEKRFLEQRAANVFKARVKNLSWIDQTASFYRGRAAHGA